MRIILAIAAVVIAVLLLLGCSNLSIKEAKTEQYIGKSVTISGTAENSLKLGKISGYTLKDDTGEVMTVKSEILPKDGEKITVSGTVIKDSWFGYYLQAEK